MISVLLCSNNGGREPYQRAGPQQKRTREQAREGRHGGPVSWSRRIGPHVAFLLTVNRSPDVPVSRLPQRRDRVPSRCGPGLTHHPVSRLRSAAQHPQGLALTRGWYTGHARMGGSYVVNVVDKSTTVKPR